jgi:hypothetical protein
LPPKFFHQKLLIGKVTPKHGSCSTATKFQLTQAEISDAHDFKAECVGKKNVSRYDICACKDGSLKIAGHGQCGKQGAKIDTYARWK